MIKLLGISQLTNYFKYLHKIRYLYFFRHYHYFVSHPRLRNGVAKYYLIIARVNFLCEKEKA